MKFYSEKLNKMFDTDKELLIAEEAAFKAEQEAKAKSLAKKNEAKVVEDAFKAHNAAKKTFNERVIARRKKYAEDLAALKAAYDADIKAESDKLDVAAQAYDKAFKEFTAKHPEGYHMTLKDGDNVVTLHSTNKQEVFNNLVNENFFDTFFNLFRI
jgi:N12 class adenine-specific DNA methylase